MSTVLVIQRDVRRRKAWCQQLEAAGDQALAAPTLLQALTTMAHQRIDALVVDLPGPRDVDILRYVATVRDLPPLVVLSDEELPPLPARVRAASCLLRSQRHDELARVVAELGHACALGDAPPARHPFRLPPEGVSKWTMVIHSEYADDCDTIPRSEFAA